jgi:putative PIN family toxin of toxin-antitoxin system
MKTTKVVIDTNVFVSGIFFSGPPSRILKAWQDDRIQIVITEEIIEEYKRVLETLAAKLQEDINIPRMMELLLIEAELAPSYSFHKPVCEDPDDDKFLACAMAAKCKYIISGDKHLLKMGHFLSTTIVTPRYFLDNLL